MIELSPETQKLSLVLLLRVWHGTPILVIISILAYFCFLEELLVLLPPRPLLFLLKLTYIVYAWYAKFTWLTGGPWRHCCTGYIAALLMYPGPLLILNHHKHGYVMTWHPRVKLKHNYIYRCLVSEIRASHGTYQNLALRAVARRYVWIYAAVQFLLVVFFTHLFYRYVSIH